MAQDLHRQAKEAYDDAKSDMSDQHARMSEDLSFSNPADPPSVIAARATELQMINQWVAEWFETEKQIRAQQARTAAVTTDALLDTSVTVTKADDGKPMARAALDPAV